MKIAWDQNLQGKIKLKLILMFLILPGTILIEFFLIIFLVKLHLIQNDIVMINLVQIIFYCSLLAIWYKPSLSHIERIKSLAASVLIGFIFSFFYTNSKFLPSTIAIIFCALSIKKFDKSKNAYK